MAATQPVEGASGTPAPSAAQRALKLLTKPAMDEGLEVGVVVGVVVF